MGTGQRDWWGRQDRGISGGTGQRDLLGDRTEGLAGGHDREIGYDRTERLAMTRQRDWQ